MRKVARIMLMIGCGFAIALMAVICLYLILVQLAAINKTMLNQFASGRMGRIFFSSVDLKAPDAMEAVKRIVLILNLIFNGLLALSIWTFIIPFSTLHNLASKKHLILNIVVCLSGNIFCLLGGILGLVGMSQDQQVTGEDI